MEWYDINRSKVTTWMFAASHFEGTSNGIPKQIISKETVYLSLRPAWMAWVENVSPDRVYARSDRL